MFQRRHRPEQWLQQRHRKVVHDERRSLARPQQAPSQQQVGVTGSERQFLELEPLCVVVCPRGCCLVEAIVTPLPIGALEVEFHTGGTPGAAKRLHAAAELALEVLQAGEGGAGGGWGGVGALRGLPLVRKAPEKVLLLLQGLVKQRNAEVLCMGVG